MNAIAFTRRRERSELEGWLRGHCVTRFARTLDALKEKAAGNHRRPFRFSKASAYLEAVGYLNSGAAFIASLVVFIDASHLLFFWS